MCKNKLIINRKYYRQRGIKFLNVNLYFLFSFFISDVKILMLTSYLKIMSWNCLIIKNIFTIVKIRNKKNFYVNSNTIFKVQGRNNVFKWNFKFFKREKREMNSLCNFKFLRAYCVLWKLESIISRNSDAR